MLRRPRISIRRLSIVGLILFVGLECLAFVSRGMHVIRTTATSQIAFSLSPVWFGLADVEDPSGDAIPFFKPDGAWGDIILESPASHTRFSIQPLYFHDKAVYRTRQGGWLLITGWVFGYALPLLALGLIWPISLAVKSSLKMTASLSSAWRRRRNLRQQLLFGEFCPSCGYDLRATSERCPECGVEFVRKTVIVAK